MDACGALCMGIIAISLVSVSMGLPVQSANDLSKAPVCKFNNTGNGPCSINMLEEINSSNDSSIDATIPELAWLCNERWQISSAQAKLGAGNEIKPC